MYIRRRKRNIEEKRKDIKKRGEGFLFQFTYDPFVAGTMGQPSHLERVIFWTKVAFSSYSII
jgi:hypothetical protein